MRFDSTVRSATNSSSAISRFEWPLAASSGDPPLGLRQLVAVLSSPTAQPRDLRARPLHPQRRPELLEDRERRLQRSSAPPPAASLAADVAQCEQRARAVERLGHGVVRRQRRLEVGERVIRRPSAAAIRPRQRRAVAIAHLPGPGLRPRFSSPACTSRAASTSPAEQRLDDVGGDAERRRLVEVEPRLRSRRGPRWRTAASPSPSESARNPSTCAQRVANARSPTLGLRPAGLGMVRAGYTRPSARRRAHRSNGRPPRRSRAPARP